MSMKLLATFLAVTLFVGFPRLAAAQAEVPPSATSERVLGDPNAKVTMIEYASLTCPHCATFHAEVLPQIKAEYIDTGKMKLIYRDFPLDRVALTASLLARCAPEERYFGMLNVLFQEQKNWARSADPVQSLKTLGRLAGVSDATFEACTTNDTLINAVVQQRVEGQQKYGIESTPTFIINGEKVSGAQPFEEFKAVIDGFLD